jgi:hypothetical protein
LPIFISTFRRVLMFPYGGFQPTGQVQLPKQVFDVDLDSGIADTQFSRDCFVVHSTCQAFKTFALSLS